MKRFKVGIIGIGQIAYTHIEALKKLDDIDIVAISSRHDIEEKSKKLGITSYYTNYKDMLDQEILDSVHICTSNDVHFEIAQYAILKGVHVILEKPMTLSLNEAIKLKKLAGESGLVTKIHFHNRFYAINQYMKENIEDVGQIISIHGEYSQGWAASREVYNWRSNKKYSGLTRVIADIGTHYFDLIEFITGHKIIEVSARLKQVFDTRGGNLIDTEDIGIVLYQTNKGAVGSVMISQSIIGNDNKLAFTISGVKGTFDQKGDTTRVRFASLGMPYKDIENRQIKALKTNETHNSTNFQEAFTEGFRQFYTEIETKGIKTDYADFTDGLHSMKIIEAIYKSHHKRKWIKLK